MSVNKYFLTDIEDVYALLDSKVGTEVSDFTREHKLLKFTSMSCETLLTMNYCMTSTMTNERGGGVN